MRGELRELLLAQAVGFDVSGPLPPPTSPGASTVDALIAEAQDAGCLRPDRSMPTDVARSLLATTPTHHVRALQRALVDGLVEIGQPLGNIARDLARSGLNDARVALALERAGDEALRTDACLASALYEEAQAAGADALALAARRAQAAAATGDIDRAAQILDDLFAHQEAPDLGRAADVAASVWGRRGLLERGVAVYRWLGSAATSAPLAAITMIGTGDRKSAAEMMSSAGGTSYPSLCAAALDLMGQGVSQSLESRPIHALPALIRASDTLTACGLATAPMPDTPAALAALVALHGGEPDVGLSVLTAAIEGGQGGGAALPRLLLLRGWSLMQLDRPDEARQETGRARDGRFPLAARDRLLLHALEAGLARRTDDRPALVRAWKQAREALLHVSVDLYSLLPLGELLVTSARLRDTTRMAPHLAEAWSLLARLGNPPLWSIPLHWSAVQAAILRERPGEVAPHAAALVHASGDSRVASAFSTAGRCWMSVLAGSVDVPAVEAAAHELESIGLTWDGSRLAGHAAAHAEDRRDMARLLALARQLHPGSAASSRGSGPPEPAALDVVTSTAPATDAVGLSPREREVARLVLAGKTYREIGEAIFISPRTAEHHIARIRRRVGATTRSDLMTRLRVVLDDDPQE
jgi:DNA-binding CsgD family transcriptional regulator